MLNDSSSLDTGLLWSAVGGTAIGVVTAFLTLTLIAKVMPPGSHLRVQRAVRTRALPPVSAGIPSPSHPEKHSAGKQPCERVEIDRSLFRLFEDAEVRPRYEDDALIGVHLFGVQSGSFWDALGLRSGDLITEMDHAAIASDEASVDLMNYVGRSPAVHLRVRAADGGDRQITWDAATQSTLEHCRP